MIMDPDPLKIDAVHQRIMASQLGPALRPVYSFVSLSEISEYVPSVEQYAQRLIAEGEQEGSPSYQAKYKAYEGRLPAMNKQRLTPEFPPWPSTWFYPMNKKRKAIAKIYDKEINLDRKIPMNNDCSYHLYWILVNNRNKFIKQMNQNKIEVGIHYKPVHQMTLYRNKTKLPVTSCRKHPKILMDFPVHHA